MKQTSKRKGSKQRDVRETVAAIFRAMEPSRSGELQVHVPQASKRLARALARDYGRRKAWEIAFHLTDWNYDAAFIVALILFPERFALDEIRDGFLRFIVHVPAHLAAAAKLADWPVENAGMGGPLYEELEGRPRSAKRPIRQRMRK